MTDYGHDVEFGVFITPASQDAETVVALATLALGTLGFAAIPALVAEGQPDPVSSWAGIWIRILSALLFAVAAFTPRRQLVALGRASIVAAVYAATAIALVVAGVWSLRGSLPAVAPPAQAAASSASATPGRIAANMSPATRATNARGAAHPAIRCSVRRNTSSPDS